MNSSPPITVDDALRGVLFALLCSIQSAGKKVLGGDDPDDIHDLRVATRRTRTALGQVPGVFPKSSLKPFRQGFKTIGTLTGACRDLDVWLDAIELHGEILPPGDSDLLFPLRQLVRRQRDFARKDVAIELSKPWFSDLVLRWGAFLHNPPAPFALASSQPIKTVAAARILKAHRRLLKHGHALPEKPTTAQFHRLRIDGKKFRYLLEFFGDLFGEERCRSLVRALKGLQDVLGGINDRAIQLQAVDELASGMSRRDPTLTAAITLHRHFLEQSLGDFQSEFGDQFLAFTDHTVTRSIADLFGPEEKPISPA